MWVMSNAMHFILFRIINFIFFLGVLFYIFNKKLLPDILLSIKTYFQKMKDKRLYSLQLLEKKEDLDRQIEQDVVTCNNLKKNIDKWQNFLEQEAKNKEKEYANTIALMEEKVAVQSKNISEEKAVLSLVPHIVVESKKDLKVKFSDSKKKDIYQNDLVNMLERL